MFKIKLKMKMYGYSLLGVSTLLSILLFAFLNDKLLEIITTIIFFFIFRKRFEKQYHAKSLIHCSIISIIVFIILTRIALRFSISILFIIILTFLTNLISFYVRDYLDKNIKTTFYKGMNADELPNDLSGVEYDIMNLYYVKRKQLEYIAGAVNYSVDNVKKLKAKILKRYS